MRRGLVAAMLALSVVPAAARAAEALDAAQAPGALKPVLYVDAYFQSGETSYLVPTLFLDRGPLHLEARYNYEDFDTASFFAGYTFTFFGEEDYLKLTPMLGAVAGNAKGLAPGLEVEARWGRLAYWLETEYFFDLGDSASSYFYSWSELDLYALPWLWIGGSLQRMKLVQTATEVDVGPALGFGPPGTPGWTVTVYAYGLSRSSPLFMTTLAVQF